MRISNKIPHIKICESFRNIPQKDWDACAGNISPFVSHAFLLALEDSGSANANTGWHGKHLIIEDPNDGIIACAPVYKKEHSYGEYVFDWAWADAYQRAGGLYYPKIQCAVPFTPVSGPRLLARNNLSPECQIKLRKLLATRMFELSTDLNASSVHITFCEEREWKEAQEIGYLQRIDQQFHWQNRNYGNFDDFLGALPSRKRKSIQKERRKVAEAGLQTYKLQGKEITEKHWDFMYHFYRSTTDKKWGPAYLTRQFFSLLAQYMAEKLLLFLIKKNNDIVAGAMHLVGEDTLYGRYWGCSDEFKYLHFEACYYQAIEYAINMGLSNVQAGAQGLHKIQRGYLPVKTYSAHFFRNQNFQDAIKKYLDIETRSVAQEISYLTARSPYKAKNDV